MVLISPPTTNHRNDSKRTILLVLVAVLVFLGGTAWQQQVGNSCIDSNYVVTQMIGSGDGGHDVEPHDGSSTTRTTAAAAATTATTTTTSTATTYDLSTACLKLPQLNPSGSIFFLNPQGVHPVPTIPEVQPSFVFGTIFVRNPKLAAVHMRGDIPYFALIQESLEHQQQRDDHYYQQIQGKQERDYIALDIGANQGFYTWFLASLGMQVHSFEIQRNNFDALQHGRVYNPKAVADRAHLYPMGLSSSIGRVTQSNEGSYNSHIVPLDNKEVKKRKKKKMKVEGTILTITLDCWAQHVQLPLGVPQPQPQEEQQQSPQQSPPRPPIQFVKLDVEGFEIAVIQGGKQSLLHHQGQVGSLLVEVAPNRWSRAGIAMSTGVTEMLRLQTDLFAYTYLLLRGEKSCSYELAYTTSLDKEIPATPVRLLSHNVQMHAISKAEELKAVLHAMLDRHSSCNFWFTNDPITTTDAS